MGSLIDWETSSTPKLSLFSLQNKPPEPTGMLTPPMHTSVSIPFQWEEAPGKPRSSTASEPPSKPKAARCLDLPPRLLNETKDATGTPSPTTVLEGPYIGRPSILSHTSSFSFRRGSFRKVDGKERSGLSSFGLWRWGSFQENKENVGGIFDCSPSKTECDTTRVQITRVKRRSSLSTFSRTSSNLWASIYGSFKQAVPWRRWPRKP